MTSSIDSGVAFITGGSGGIGASIARRLASRGDAVVITYVNGLERAEALVQELTGTGAQASAVRLDLRDEAAVSATLAEVAAREGGIRTVISAHGPFIHMRHVSKLEPSLFRETVAADTFATYNLLHHAIPYLRQSRGSITAMSTAATGRYASTDILSVAPKAGIEALIRGIAVEEGRFGIRANCIAVGLLEDGMFDALVRAGSFTKEFIDVSISHIPLRRMGHSKDIAAAAAFLSSEDAAYITGQVLRVDGGYAV